MQCNCSIQKNISLQAGIWNWGQGGRDHIQHEVNNIRGEVRREDAGRREGNGEPLGENSGLEC